MRYKAGGTIQSETLFKMEFEKDIFRKDIFHDRSVPWQGAWTVALCELIGHNFVYLEYKTDVRTYRISLADASKVWKKMTFQGVEKYVIPIYYWSKSDGLASKIVFPIEKEQLTLF
jgi:hypothetical protein